MALVIIRPGETEHQLISPGTPVSTSFDVGSTIEVLCGSIKKLFPRDWRKATAVELSRPRRGPQGAARSKARAKRTPRKAVR